jgi:hypothetical protein
MALSQPQLVELNSKMNQVFSLDEIESLCFDMGIDFDSLGGEGKGAKIRELIEFCRRRGRDEELVAKVRAERPQVAWPGAPAPAGGGGIEYNFSSNAQTGGTAKTVNYIDKPKTAQPPKTMGRPTMLRLDVAVPEKVSLGKSFVLAAAVRQPSSPRLTGDEYEKVASSDAMVVWPSKQAYVQLGIEIIAPDCGIEGRNQISFQYSQSYDSTIHRFSLVPRVTGPINIIVNLYQEDESLGSASVKTTVSEEPVGRVEITTRSDEFKTFDKPLPRKVTILFLAANPKSTDRLRLDEEVRTIDERLRLAQYRDKFNLEQQWAVRTGDILDAMLRYKPDIVHFSGHGSTDGALIFEDASGKAKPVSAAALGMLFHALEGVRCVVMNACWSNTHATQIAKDVDCVIGMARSVSDDTAIGFAAGFYRSLGEGKSVGKAFELGKVQIMLDGGSEQSTPRLRSRSGVNPGDVTFA